MIIPTEPPRAIQSYILRIWAEEEEGCRVWRASLTAIPSGERLGFASLQMAFKFLEGQTATLETQQRREEKDHEH